MRHALLLAAAACALSACQDSAPYPNPSPIYGARVSANPHSRGSEAFCREYARQTAGNSYENNVDRGEDSFGVRVFTEQQARRQGDDAYRRCRAGRTG